MSGPSFEQLNAYVDSELPPRQAADVARAVAGDPTLAEQVALLARLRSTLAESIEVPELKLPPPKPPWHRRHRRIAAACVAAILLLAAGLALPQLSDPRQADDWLQAAWALHQGWPAAGGSAPAAVPASSLEGVYVPDLSATRLTVASVARRPFAGDREATVVGYSGTRGCKLTLVIARIGRPLEDAFRRHEQGGRVAYSWRAGALGFVLLAEAMDGARFDLIARSVYRASIERLPFDDTTRMALVKSRRASRPCHA